MELWLEIIAGLRKAGMNQEEFAAHAGITRETLSRIVNEKTKPQDETLSLIDKGFKALGIDVGVLLSDSEVAEGGGMGRSIPGTRQVPVGYDVVASIDEDDTLRVLREALARVSTLEMTGRATKTELVTLRRLVARLEGHEVSSQE